MPVESALGGQPTSTVAPAGLVSVTLLNRRSVGPSNWSNAAELLPIGLAGFSGWFSFSSKPVPSSYSVIENVLVAPPTRPPPPTQHSKPNSGTLIQRTLNSLLLANPSAITGKVLNAGAPAGFVKVPGNWQLAPKARLPGFRSAQAAAIFGRPRRNAGIDGNGLVSPRPNVMFPFEFQKIEFQTVLIHTPDAVVQLALSNTLCPAASVTAVRGDVTVKQFPDRENPTTVPPTITQPPGGNAAAADDDVSVNDEAVALLLQPATVVPSALTNVAIVPDAAGKQVEPNMNSKPPESGPIIGPSGDAFVGLFAVGIGPSRSSSSPRNGGF